MPRRRTCARALQVLLFLDSHIEATRGWLEPLLATVAADRTAVVAPVIDIIDADNMAYRRAATALIGGFTWALTYAWIEAPARERERIRGKPTLPLR